MEYDRDNDNDDNEKYEEYDENNYNSHNGNDDGNQNDDLQKYFSNGEGEKHHGKIWQDDYEGEPDEINKVPLPLSLDDLNILADDKEEVKKEQIAINSTYYSNTYWKVEEAYTLDQLMEEYQK